MFQARSDKTHASISMELKNAFNLAGLSINFKYTLDYYLAITNNEIVLSTAKWTDLEIITLNEVSQRKTNVI